MEDEEGDDADDDDVIVVEKSLGEWLVEPNGKDEDVDSATGTSPYTREQDAAAAATTVVPTQQQRITDVFQALLLVYRLDESCDRGIFFMGWVLIIVVVIINRRMTDLSFLAAFERIAIRMMMILVMMMLMKDERSKYVCC